MLEKRRAGERARKEDSRVLLLLLGATEGGGFVRMRGVGREAWGSVRDIRGRENMVGVEGRRARILGGGMVGWVCTGSG